MISVKNISTFISCYKKFLSVFLVHFSFLYYNKIVCVELWELRSNEAIRDMMLGNCKIRKV